MIKKTITYMLISAISFIALTTNCMAANNAYSVGCQYASGVEGEGTTSVPQTKTAANAYGWLSGYNSYYSLKPTYSYLKSTSRLGGSRVFFIAGHANQNLISVAAQDSDAYRTGISRYADGYVDYDAVYNKKYTYAGLTSRNMSNTLLITFAGCKTASTEKGANNLLTQAIASGAKAAVGFNNLITNKQEDIKWLEKYNTLLGNGWSIKYSMEKATAAYNESRCAKYVTSMGNTDLNLGKLAQKSAELVQYVSEKRKNEEDDFIIYKSSYTDSLKELFEKKEEKPELIKNIISEIDSSFNYDDYKVEYNLVDDKGFGFIFLTYYINPEIKTNKGYMIVTNNYKIDKIYLSGIRKENIKRVSSINENTILEKYKIFNKKEKSNVINKTNISNNISDEKTATKVIKREEEYFLDYNTGELTFTDTVFKESNTGIYSNSIVQRID